MNTIIRCEDVQKTFTIDKKEGIALNVLKGISLEIVEGEMLSIVGASGSGKSTLLHILGGLDTPSNGRVFWDNKEIFKMNEEAISRLRISHVGFVFQFHHLLPEFTALENVMIASMINGKTQKEAKEIAEEILARVQMSERLHHKPAELSGGEQQRTAVARALANKPKVIFADEPSGNLDSVNSERLLDLLWELNQSQKQTFVIVTHNENFAARSGRVFRMTDGKLMGIKNQKL
jgi:lipoprotein-releasing system ATP-binding protein